jgi:hypothetical protein
MVILVIAIYHIDMLHSMKAFVIFPSLEIQSQPNHDDERYCPK